MLIVAAVIIVFAVFFSFVPIRLWISATAAGVRVGIFNLIGMRIRKVSPQIIVNPMIKATKAGLDLSINKLEAHHLAGGNVDRVVNALIAAQRAEITLEFERAAAIDLAGRDVLTAVQMSVNPKVIETPVVAAIAKDGIELRAKARVTVGPTSTAWWAAPERKPSSPGSARASSPPWVPPIAIRLCWKTPI